MKVTFHDPWTGEPVANGLVHLYDKETGADSGLRVQLDETGSTEAITQEMHKRYTWVLEHLPRNIK
jgi:hypothetical protein